jgi:hypothetical protein
MVDSPERVRLPAATCERYAALSLFNSPYPAHDAGRAVDLYPADDRAPSPVAGRVRETLATGAPSRPGAAPEDHLLLVDVDRVASGLGPGRPLVARVLHVDPAVAPGDRVAVGDDLGSLVDSGYFAPWVDPHLHLGVRPPDRDLRRASGSLPVALGVDPTPLAWDGRGRVVETGETWLRLDAPVPTDETGWVGLGAAGAVLDGGLPHYAGGGALGDGPDGPLSLLGTTVGDRDGRRVAWREVELRAEGAVGLSLVVARADVARGVTVVAPGHARAVGDDLRLSVVPGERPRLGRPSPG